MMALNVPAEFQIASHTTTLPSFAVNVMLDTDLLMIKWLVMLLSLTVSPINHQAT
jgi:hypothetical protein